MAAIDFPAAPIVGQLFPAPNNVIYRFDGTLWLAVGNLSGPGPGGDFMAVSTVDISLTGAGLVLILPTVLFGNAGNWYSPVTGRWTPPPGRFFVQVQFSAWNGGGTSGTSTLQLRKNGVAIPNGYGSTTPSGNQGMAVATALVDANGTDYFDCFGLTGASQGMVRPTFQAFPISGIKGPPGDPPWATPTGDFFARATQAEWVGAVDTYKTIAASTVASGNSPIAYYNPTTGAYTPPAGRYRLFATCSYYSTVGNCRGYIRILKNGVLIPQSENIVSNAGNSYFAQVMGDVIVDANGSDVFTFQSYFGIALPTTLYGGTMGAYPISGVRGLPGPAGDLPSGLKLYSEQVAIAGDTQLRVNFPATAKRVELEFGLSAASVAANIDVRLQGLIGAAADVAAVHQTLGHYQYHNAATPTPFFHGTRPDWTLGSLLYMAGTVRIPMVNFALDATNKQQAATSELWANQLTYGRMHQTSSHDKYDASVWTGYRVYINGAGAFAPGSFLRCYAVVPAAAVE